MARTCGGRVDDGMVAAIVLTFRLRGPSTSAPPEITSLAVLPLENLSGDATQDYFADGMSEELTTSLAKSEPYG